MKKVKRFINIAITCIILLSVLSSASLASSGEIGQLNKYEVLLNNSKIAEALAWEERWGIQSYNKWPIYRKTQLMEAISRIENNEPFPLQSPPELINGKYFSDNDAWTIYITHVAHTLWLEANRLVNWSILDYAPPDLEVLLNSSTMLHYEKSKGYDVPVLLMGNVTDWNIESSYRFLKENGYILDDPASTVYAFAGWIRDNVRHFYQNGNESDEKVYKRFWDYQGPPPVDRILYPISDIDGGTSYSAGCWGTTGLFSAVLRSVNIPVKNEIVRLGIPGFPGMLHSGIKLPTIGIGIVHSDDFYNRWTTDRRYGQAVPTEKLFNTFDWLNTNIFDPTVLDKGITYSNSKEDQASYNFSKYAMELANENMSDFLVYQRALSSSQKAKPTELINNLTGISVNRDHFQFAKPFYSAEEIAEIVRKVDAELIRIGGGDWKKGASIVRKTGKPLIINLASGNNTALFDASLSPAAFKQQLVLRSSDKSIITVSDTGLITGLKKGMASITASRPDGTKLEGADRTVIVTYLAKEIVITGDDTVASGKKITLKAQVLPKETINKKVVWESSDTDIANVSSSGVVTAKKTNEIQTVTITATAQDGSGVSAVWVVTVIPKK